MSIKTTIVARLSKHGTEVLCGRPICGKKLADALTNKGGGVHALRTNGRPPRRFDFLTPFAAYPASVAPASGERCNIVFPPGWWQDDKGLWALTSHARRRYDDDRQLASGNPGVDPREGERARRRLISGRSAAFRQRSAENQPPWPSAPRQVAHRATLPTVARCPDCQGINRLEPRLEEEAIAKARSQPVLDSAVAGANNDIN